MTRATRARLVTAGFHTLNAIGELTHVMPPTVQTIVRKAWLRAHDALVVEANAIRAEAPPPAQPAASRPNLRIVN